MLTKVKSTLLLLLCLYYVLLSVSGSDVIAESLSLESEDATPIHIPEPMVFDLVRGLNSRQGELEVNTLALVRRRDGNIGAEWAPEIEYAIVDGLAFELELPFEDEKLESVKLGAQYTFGYGESYIHGTQVLIVGDIVRHDIDATFLYLFGYKLTQNFSIFLMSGLAFGPDTFPNIDEESSSGLDFINNVSLFYQFDDDLSFGLEVNTLKPENGNSEILLMPQIHTSLGEHLSLQLGLGARRTLGVSRLELGGRIIFEF